MRLVPIRRGKQKRRLPLRIHALGRRRFLFVTRKEEFLVLGRPGSDLLSQGLSHSTIGAEEFNGRVRDGIGLRLFARATRPAKHKERSKRSFVEWRTTRSHLVTGLAALWTLK